MASTRADRWWGYGLAPLTAIVRPIATVRGTGRMPLWWAGVVHGVGVVWALVVLATLVAWATAVPVEEAVLAGPWATGERLLAMLDALPDWFSQREVVLVAIGGVLAAEGGVIVMAWLLMAWGARDELVPAAFTASLRRLWCLTPHVALVLLVGGAIVVPLRRASLASVRDWQTARLAHMQQQANQQAAQTQPQLQQQANQPPLSATAPATAPAPATQPATIPAAPLTRSGTQPATNPATASASMNVSYQRHMAGEPWYVRYWSAIQIAVAVAASLWGMLQLLRVGVARRWSARCRWPPVCDKCGYTLLGITRAANCPECGQDVAASVGEATRPGFAQRPGRGGRAWRRWWRDATEPWLAPVAFGRQLRALHPEGAHRRLLAVNLALATVLTLAGALGWAWSVTPAEGTLSMNDAMLIMFFALVAAPAGLLFFTLVVGSLIGSMATRLTLFPLLAVGAQVACGLGGYALGWSALNWLMMIGISLGHDAVFHPDWPWLADVVILSVAVVNVAALVWAIVAAWRGVMAARFANW